MKDRECMYCTENDMCTSQMIYVGSMRVSQVYFLKNQYYSGRCVVAYHRHCEEIYEMTEEERKNFFQDVSDVAEIIKNKYAADKMNYAIYGDEVPHVHMHLVPKYRGEQDWGGAFDMKKQGEELDKSELTRQVEELAELIKEKMGGMV